METRFLTIDAKRLTVYGEGTRSRASGGGTVYYTTLPRRTKRTHRPGAVVDLQDYRRRLSGAEEEELVPEEDITTQQANRTTARLGLLPDLVAAAAVVCMVVLVSIKFLLL